MRKILFVCHGNICRSQMADSIASHLAALKGVSDDFYFDSAATSREEIGSLMYPPAQNMLIRENIPVKKHRARQITTSDLSYFDEIYYMDGNNLYNLRRMFPKYDFHNIHPMLDRDIADPWYTGNFDETYSDLIEALQIILNI